MKRCPKCRRDYNDDSLSFCLDDGTELLYGPASMDEPATAILSEPPASAGGQFALEDPTQPFIQTTASAEPQPSLGGDTEKPRFSAHRAAKPLIAAAIAIAVLVGGFVGYRYFSSGNSKQINSIAVMPFVNESGNADVEYLSDGMTETLIKSLSQIPDLNVRPRSSVFRYKGKETDPQTIGKELNVQAILNGRIIQRGQDISLFVELIDISLDKVIWSQQYNRKQSDLVTLQSDVARDVLGNLKTKLSGTDEAKVTKTYTTDPEAYQLYLKGNYYRTKYNKDGYKKAIEYYKQAIELDPNYAMAYVGIGASYFLAAGWYLPPNEAMPQSKAAALKALDLDESLAEAHSLIASYEVWYGWNWENAEKEAKRAIELNPKVGHDQYSYYLAAMGRMDQSVEEMELYQSLFPLDLVANSSLANMYLFGGQTEKAIEQARKTIELDQNYAPGYKALGLAYARKQMYPEAIASLEKAYSLDNTPELMGYEGYVYATAGKKAEALRIVEQLKSTFSKFAPDYNIAGIYAKLNDNEKAFEWINKAIDHRAGPIAFVKVDPLFDEIRSDAPFKDVLKRMDLPE